MKKIKMYRIVIFLCILISILCTFSGCGKSTDNLLVISSPNNKTINYYKYNISKKISDKIYSTDKTCYPTAALSKDNKTLYFTKQDKDRCAQLFERNLSTNEEKQLTSKENNKIVNVDFFKVNYNKNLIYLRIVKENHRNFSIAIYYIKSNKLKILDEDEKDLSNQFFDFSNSSNSILTFQNSIQKEFDLADQINKTQNFKLLPNYNIILKDSKGKDEKVYGAINNNIIDVSLSPNKQSAIILVGEVVDIENNNFKEKIVLKDLNSNNQTESIISTGKVYKDISKISFSKNGDGFYFVASKLNENNNLYYYDLNNKTTSLILKIDNENILDCIASH